MSLQARPPHVGFQARDRTARPCGREGELDLRAAMCGRGRARGDYKNRLEETVRDISRW